MADPIFDTLSSLLRVLVIAPLAYACLVVLLRLSGKRTLAQLNAFDFIVTVALGSTLATIALSSSVALAEGALTLVLQAGLAQVVRSTGAGGGLDLVAAVVVETNGTMSVTTRDRLGSGSAMDGVPGWR